MSASSGRWRALGAYLCAGALCTTTEKGTDAVSDSAPATRRPLSSQKGRLHPQAPQLCRRARNAQPRRATAPRSGALSSLGVKPRKESKLKRARWLRSGHDTTLLRTAVAPALICGTRPRCEWARGPARGAAAAADRNWQDGGSDCALRQRHNRPGRAAIAMPPTHRLSCAFCARREGAGDRRAEEVTGARGKPDQPAAPMRRVTVRCDSATTH